MTRANTCATACACLACVPAQRGDSLRRDLVHKMFGNAKSNTRVTRGRRHTATAAAGLEAWALFAQRAAMEGKDLLDGASGFNHKDEPEKPRCVAAAIVPARVYGRCETGTRRCVCRDAGLTWIVPPQVVNGRT